MGFNSVFKGLKGFRKYLMCVQNILQTDESTITCMIFGLNKIQYNTVQIQSNRLQNANRQLQDTTDVMSSV